MNIKRSEKVVVVVGLFATGKTTLVNRIIKMHPDYKVYHTDDFIHYSHNLQTRFLLNKIQLDKPERYIVEGAIAYRLLRSGVLNNEFYPDVVVNCVASDGERQKRYLSPERWNGGRYKGDNKTGLKDFKAFDNQYRKIWTEYLHLPKKREPRIIEYVTEPGYNDDAC